MSKRTKKSVGKSLDRLWSLVVRKRDNHTCQKCGKPATEVHHIFGRRNFSTRWNIQNGISLCPACHTWGKNSLEQSPYLPENRAVILQIVGGEEELDKLATLANTPYKSTLNELIELESKFKEILT